MLISNDICEAELFALNMGLKASLPIRNMLDELAMIDDQEQVIDLICDNKSAIDLSKHGFKNCSKHYAMTMLYVNEFVARGEVVVSDADSSKNPADMFTKFIDYSNYDTFCKLIKLVDTSKLIKA